MLSFSNHFYTHMYFIKIYYIILYYIILYYIILYYIISYYKLYYYIIWYYKLYIYIYLLMRLILDSFARSSNTRENELKAEWADFFVTRLWFSMMIRVNLCRAMHYFDKSSQHQSISKHIKAHIQTITAQHTTWDGIKWYGSIFSLQLTACLVV